MQSDDGRICVRHAHTWYICAVTHNIAFNEQVSSHPEQDSH